MNPSLFRWNCAIIAVLFRWARQQISDSVVFLRAAREQSSKYFRRIPRDVSGCLQLSLNTEVCFYSLWTFHICNGTAVVHLKFYGSRNFVLITCQDATRLNKHNLLSVTFYRSLSFMHKENSLAENQSHEQAFDQLDWRVNLQLQWGLFSF